MTAQLAAEDVIQQTGSFGWVWLIAMLGTAIIGAVGTWAASKYRAEPETHVTLPNGERYDTTGMSQQLVTMLSAALTRAATAEAKLDHLEERLDAVGDDRDALLAEQRVYTHWWDNGQPPPPPTPSPRVRQIIADNDSATPA